MVVHSFTDLFIYSSNSPPPHTDSVPGAGAMEMKTGFLPSWAHSLVGKVDQYANQWRKVICRVTGVCKGPALPGNVEKVDLEGWVKDAKRVEGCSRGESGACKRALPENNGKVERDFQQGVKVKEGKVKGGTIQFSMSS